MLIHTSQPAMMQYCFQYERWSWHPAASLPISLQIQYFFFRMRSCSSNARGARTAILPRSPALLPTSTFCRRPPSYRFLPPSPLSPLPPSPSQQTSAASGGKALLLLLLLRRRRRRRRRRNERGGWRRNCRLFICDSVPACLPVRLCPSVRLPM